MEISALEINLLLRRIDDQIRGYFLSGAYSMDDGVLLRFNHEIKPEKVVALTSFAPWITKKNFSAHEASKFVSRLRDQIDRCEIISVDQLGNERIARFSFENRKSERRNLYVEFFAHGNVILTDPSNDDLIIDVATPQTFRHRILRQGERYVLPPPRGYALQEVSGSDLFASLKDSLARKDDSTITAVRWFGRTVGTSRKFVEEVFFRTNLDPNASFSSLNSSSLDDIAHVCSELCTEVERSDLGYVLVPSDESDLEVDVCPIVTHLWRTYSERGLATIENHPALNDALDEIAIQSYLLQKRRVASATTRAKAEELSSAISKQQTLLEQNRTNSKHLRILANVLIGSVDPKIPDDVVQQLMTFKLVKLLPESPNQPRFVTEPKSYLRSFTSTSLASRLFNEAKGMEAANSRIEQVIVELTHQRADLLERTKSQEDRVLRKSDTNRRERQWFERYRWFVSSDDRLVVGGRDSTSNSIVINKYTNPNDIVFHADIHGSPFFVLGSGGMRTAPSEDMALEIAQATVAFSRAWKDELGSADAYWVFGDQVKKSAPSGEYLPKGSFFIEGKKNFVRHLRVELAIGITSHIPDENSMEIDQNQVVIVCGPEKSIGKHCYAFLRIAPGKEKTSEFSKHVLNRLVARISNEEVKEITKKISKDDVIRVLPSGEYKLVSEK
ncbi:MAG: NFACT family protein [Nitrososphaerota archaeon]|nr:NFACT family protein [Nitrososphaerota archaeon]MDG6923223.1 NFACT family protein [Nitrososphaerota archaeon]